MSEQNKSSLQICLMVIMISAVAGGFFGLPQNEYQISGFWRGALTGTLISAPIVFFEVFFINGKGGRSLRKAPLWVFFTARTAVYTAATLVGESLARLPFTELAMSGTIALDAALFSTFVFTIVITSIFNLILVVNQLLGKNVLFNLLTGRYHRPRREERIFLFADMVGSTAIAERLGNEAFLRLLNRCFFDIGEPVLRYGGEIYRYVGDEVIVSWKLGDRKANMRALNCATAISEALGKGQAGFLRDFDVAPVFRVALHAGPVVAGEIGDYKREVTFLGDVVNTTARIEQVCGKMERSILASADIINMSDTPPGMVLENLGPVKLRGKAEPMELYAILI